MSIDYGRKLEDPEQTHVDMGRTCKRHTEKIFSMLLWNGFPVSLLIPEKNANINCKLCVISL